MKPVYAISNLSAHLFWDVDVSALDFEKSKSQIIYKVVEFGNINDWNIIKTVYGLETIKNISLQFRSLDVVTLSFLSHLFQLKKSNFRCYKLKQSNQNYWNY
ncbi:MAG: hypothetical protein COX70_03030 [Flavobacteriales bacterium CG_4_10_14_0_2_um_filter_32_8]|nr:MAG: hypothetical protein COX70_03030 [Flavobacteriales bacterium CG_4_10_14_0_2_um_filter_32_8]PJB14954.1 MAG: hypothetical protein CO118_05885 [Flavobacteriales bacterium CG_4_9_14_3_um_filter_32_8]